MRVVKFLPLLVIASISLLIAPAKAEETLKPAELPAKHLVERGNQKNDLHDYEGAISDYKAALKIKPDYARAAFNLGVAACNTGDHHGEVRYFGKAFELNPSDYEALTARGMAYLKLGSVQQAKNDLDRSLKLNSNYQRTYWGLGKAGMQEGNYSAALINLNKTLQIDPNFFPAYGDRALVYQDIARMFSNGVYVKEAIADHSQVINSSPEYAQAYRDRAWYYLQLGKDQLAISDFHKAADLHAKQNEPQQQAGMMEVISILEENLDVAKEAPAKGSTK